MSDCVRNLDEDRHDAERDQPEQRPDEHAGESREVAARRISGGPETGDEEGSRPAGLPHRLRIRRRVVGEGRRDRQSGDRTEAEQQRDRRLLGPLHRDVHADEQQQGADEEQPPPPVGEVAADDTRRARTTQWSPRQAPSSARAASPLRHGSMPGDPHFCWRPCPLGRTGPSRCRCSTANCSWAPPVGRVRRLIAHRPRRTREGTGSDHGDVRATAWRPASRRASVG